MNMNPQSITWIDTRDKPALLYAMMKNFMNDSKISFEGTLKDLYFYNSNDSSHEETKELKRQTISPKLDFVVIPITENNFNTIWNEISEKDHLVHEGIIHVQIEKNGKLVFGGYDNFHRECVVIYSDVSTELLEALKSKGIIRGYKTTIA